MSEEESHISESKIETLAEEAKADGQYWAPEERPDWAVLADADKRGSSAKEGARQFPEPVRLIAGGLKEDASQLLQYTRTLPKLLHKSDGKTSFHPVVGPKTAALEKNLTMIDALLEEVTSRTNLDSEAQRDRVQILWKEIEKTPKLLASAAGYNFKDIAEMKHEGGEGSMFYDKICNLGEAHYGLEKEMGFVSERKHGVVLKDEAKRPAIAMAAAGALSAAIYGGVVALGLDKTGVAPGLAVGNSFFLGGLARHYFLEVGSFGSPFDSKLVKNNFEKLDEELKTLENKAAHQRGGMCG